MQALSVTALGQKMEFEIALRMRHLDELQERIGRGQRLSHEELAARYLPLAADYEKLKSWIQAQGLSITGSDSSHVALFVSGSAAQIQRALKTQMVGVAFNGYTGPAASTAPSLPESIGAAVLGINGLQPYIVLRKKQAELQPAIGNQAPYLIKEVLGAYNGANLGVTGAGQTIAILIDTVPRDSDLVKFWSDNGIAQSLGNIENINVNNVALPPTQFEETLDVEWSSGIASGAKVRVYAAGSLTFVDINRALLRIFNDAPGLPGMQQLSISLGLGEKYLPQSIISGSSQYFALIASAGISIFVSSGDEGSNPDFSNDGDPSGPLQVLFFASDPCVTAVGGTNLFLDKATGAVTSEVAWDGSGGGVSVYFKRPAWQTGAGVPGGSARLVPDVSAVGGISTPAYIVYNGLGYKVAGTSWSAPTWAGFCALINEGRAKASMGPLGLLNPWVYPLLGSANFRDIVTGNNGAYSTGLGYDLVTGVGVPNLGVLFQTLSTPNTPRIGSLSPLLGQVSTLVTLRGTHLDTAQSVEFNGVGATILSNAADSITVAVPEGALSGAITVRTAAGTAQSPGSFTVANPPVAVVAGTYRGLVSLTPGAGRGVFSATVNARGTFSATVRQDGRTRAFTGTFTPQGTFVRQTGQGASSVELDLSFVSGPARVGLVGALAAGGKVAVFEAGLCVTGRTGAGALAGRYTFLLESDAQLYPAPNYPRGDGFASLTVSAAGAIRVAGRFGDMQPFVAGASLRMDASFVLAVSAYKNALGGVAGEVGVDANSGELKAGVTWVRPSLAVAPYAGGFEIPTALLGARYVRPPRNTPVFQWAAGAGTLAFSDGQLVAPFQVNVTLSGGNKLTEEQPGGEGLRMSLDPLTGFLRGSFLHLLTGRRVPYYGVCIQGRDIARGVFSGPLLSGLVAFGPR